MAKSLEQHIEALEILVESTLAEVEEGLAGILRDYRKEHGGTSAHGLDAKLRGLEKLIDRTRSYARTLTQAELKQSAQGLTKAEQVELDNERGAMAAERAAGA
jgi:uncharacterized protein YicC (UPF0701 family)